MAASPRGQLIVIPRHAQPTPLIAVAVAVSVDYSEWTLLGGTVALNLNCSRLGLTAFCSSPSSLFESFSNVFLSLPYATYNTPELSDDLEYGHV